MPTYGSSKARSILRDSLASGRRKAARTDKRNVHRRHRSTINQTLSSYARMGPSSTAVQAYEEDGADVTSFPNDDISQIMWDRRTDNLGASFRWAPALVADVRQEDRLSKLRSILPDTVAGRHLIGHLGYQDAFISQYGDDGFVHWLYMWGSERRRYPQATLPNIAFANVEWLLHKVLAKHRGHKDFNAALRILSTGDPHYAPTAPRYFNGEHDIRDFVAEVFAPASPDMRKLQEVVVAHLEIPDEDVRGLHVWAKQDRASRQI